MRDRHHREFGRLSDEELRAAADVALKKAHEAPRALSGTEEAPAFNSTSDSAARFGDEWSRIRQEMRHRGMQL